MKKILVITGIVISVLEFNGNTQAQKVDPVESIRQHYAQINSKLASYRKVKKDLSGFSAEGGELVAYFHGPSIMKMVATYFGETGKATEEFYYWNGRLIFVWRQELRYDKPLSGKVVGKKENRYYFADDKLIRWIDENGKEVANTQSAESEYLKSSKEFSEAARSKSKSVESKQ